MIKQGRVSGGIRNFKFLNKYNLEKYNDLNKSAVFFGCYTQEDINKICNHKVLGLLVWGGSDSQIITTQNLRRIKKRKNIKHIAQSKFIEQDLKRAGIACKRLPITTIKSIPDPQPLGDSIYCYAPKCNYNFYGGQILDKLKKLLPNERFIITLSPGQYSKDQLIELYKKCFIGLRFTKHDGLPHTVIELGLMGRKCIYNDNLPNAINWRTIPDIIRIIKAEKLMIGQTNIQLANAIANFINIDNTWLNEKFWL